METAKPIARLSIWNCEIGILNIDAQLNSLELEWIQRLLNSTDVVQNGFMLYQLNKTKDYY